VRLEERIISGNFGYRRLLFGKALNEWYILTISQAIRLYRRQKKIDGPLFLGLDTHALAPKGVDESSNEKGYAGAA